MGIRGDWRPVSRVSAGSLGAVTLVLGWRPGKAVRASTWQRGTSGAPDSRRPDGAQSLLELQIRIPGLARLGWERSLGLLAQFQSRSCTSASSRLPLSRADLRPGSPPLLLDNSSRIHAKTWLEVLGPTCENSCEMHNQPPLEPEPRNIRLPAVTIRIPSGLRILGFEVQSPAIPPKGGLFLHARRSYDGPI